MKVHKETSSGPYKKSGKRDNLEIIFQITPLKRMLRPITASRRDGSNIGSQVMFSSKIEILSLNFPQYPLCDKTKLRTRTKVKKKPGRIP